ncbi:diguanylate cyclase (GGDEF)-like protein [Clostridium punense]|uniref:Diguanylate cyclase (GGDEF)-like protein n=1 Tax=Clostridium punense TaxID=1054297 RepID=A0ABS4K2C4_9CLOT|nr:MULTISPECIES: EAL domain-containing protein [Clostridium]EQB87573.1 hypothetical protein M918_08440 [Clostridium sp. BL8]MBP2021396.1 diguanylate cyclase (GGDEF)-like protein [Clostridium punense]
MKYFVSLWKKQSLFLRLFSTLLISMALVFATAYFLELARDGQVFGLGWGEKPEDELIILRCVSINFINMCSVFSYHFIEESNGKVRLRIVLINWLVSVASWMALIFSYFQVSNFPAMEKVINLIGVSSIMLSIYWLYFFSYLFSTVKQRLENEKTLAKEFLRQAITDKLTGLKNRTAFGEDLEKALELCRKNNKVLSVIFFDLDRFKYINDAFGHNTGDELLKKVADLLGKYEDEHRQIYRLGGDEFTIITFDSQEDVTLSESIIKNFKAPINIEGREIYITTSIGIARYPEAGEDVEILTRNADSAMYVAKEQGKNRCCIYNRNMHHKLSKRLELENNIRRAISEEEFFLNFQPIVNMVDNSITSFEVFIRWNHPDKGIVMPGAFIPLAEETGLIVPIGEWVLKNACAEFKKSIKNLGKKIKLAVNLSAAQLQQRGIVDTIKEILEETNFNPMDLELEVTESSIMINPEESIRKLRMLRDKGISIIIDDFGIEYSSLNYLKHLPYNTLKIDKCFISDIISNKADASITEAIIQLGHNLGVTVVAEGVETKEQYEMLKVLGCDRIQGYYFSKPVNVDNLSELFHK